MIDFKHIENRFLEDLEIDYVPLNDLVREFSGFDHPPSEDDFINTLKFLSHVLDAYNVRCLKGPEMKEINKTTQEIIDFLTKKWYSGQYNQIDYGIWFEKI